MKTNILGLKKWKWKENLSGFFTCNGKSLTDSEARKVIEYGISKGYKYDSEITNEDVKKILNGEYMSKEIIEVKAFQVPCCENVFKTMKGARIHMSLCCSNVENRACKTCKTFESSLGCDHISCEGGYLEGITIHCSDWERK